MYGTLRKCIALLALSVLASCGGDGNDEASSASVTFGIDVTVDNNQVQSQLLTPGDRLEITIHGGQELHLESSDGIEVAWNPSSPSLQPTSVQSSPLAWDGIYPVASPDSMTFTITANSDPSKTATLVVNVEAPPQVTATRYGTVKFFARDMAATKITSLVTHLTVPEKPLPKGTLFLWPGLQPSPQSANFNPINNGVLQPVLSWGPSCALGAQPPKYTTWWVSAQYVNTKGSEPGFTGCQGGPIMEVSPGDVLEMSMWLNGEVWHQTVKDLNTQQSVAFDISLRGQDQNYADFIIERWNGATTKADVVFTDTTITWVDPRPYACSPKYVGPTDVFTTGIVSNGGTQCSVKTIILRAQPDN